MKHETVGVMVFTYKYDFFYLDARYEDYKDLINEVKEACTPRYKRYRLLSISLKDGDLTKIQNEWVYTGSIPDNRFPDGIVVET